MGEKVNTSVLSSMLNISSYKKSFDESSIKTARKYGFQGIDLFWLWPNTASDMTNMGILLDEWRAEVNSESRKSGQTQLILTMALHYLPTFEFGSYPIDSIQRNMDFAHVVAYDYHLPSKENLTHAHAALYDPSSIVNTDYGIREWLAKGFPSNKLLLGLPYHGYAWALANPKENAIGSPSSGKAETQDGSMSYKYIKGYIQSYGATIIFNSPYVVNYCIIGSTWINFDDVEAIRAKIAYVKEKKQLGYNVFQLSNDDNWVLSLAAQEKDGQENKRRLLLIILLPIALVIVLLAFVICYLRGRVLKSKGMILFGKRDSGPVTNPSASENLDHNVPNLQVFSFSSIKAATNDFSSANKLGEGGFGPVYKEAVACLEEIKKSMEAKMALRQSNLNPERPDSGFLRTLDSSIKRNTAVIKKLKQINEEQREGLMEDLRGVNLSKFVSEAVTAICDAKLRSSDIQAAVQICSLLHQRYKDFSPSLIQGLLKIFFPGKSGDDLDADRNLKAMKKRSTLKLLLELYFVGVIEDSGIFNNIIKDLTSLEHLKDRDTTQTNLTLLGSFARQGRIFLGLPLSGQEIHEEFFKVLNITADQKKFFRKAFHTYYDAAAELLQSEHSSLHQMEHENAKILNAKGELSDENVSSYEKLRKSYDHLYRNVSSLAEALDMQPPVMPEDGHTTRLTTGEDASPPVSGKDSSVLEAIWDDEDTRAFYECLPDLRAFVPAVLLGEAEPKVNEQSAKTQEQHTELAPESDQGQQATPDTAEVSADSGDLQEGKSIEKGKDKEEKEKTKDSDKEKGKEKEADKKGENEKEKLKSLEGTNLDALSQRLPGCVSRDLIDQLTVEFCYLNSKSSRKKLVRALFNVPRTSLELLPYYSRMVATLSTCMKDVSSMLLQMLEEEFNFLINKKDQMNIETKIRNIRFIGELCKFKIAPAGLVFSCLKACLDDFTHHNIDVACNLLETSGRFLYRSPETTIRMANMLEILMRLKNVKNLDPRHSTLVENAYYLCKPPERSARVTKVRPPLYQYIRKLLFSDLDKTTIEHILRQLRKFPWSECEPYLLKCFMKVHKGKYGQIHLIASLTAGLSRYHDEFAVAVVDEVLEEIRLGLEVNDYGMQQRRIAHMRFLGELYNYEHVDSSVIFETLNLILVFGQGTPEQDALDPPEDCFRIRMVIILLETCGHYFDRGSSKRKLDRFLVHFQRYILSKGALPLDVEFDLQDLFAELRPNMTRYPSIEEVNAALIELEEHEHAVSTDKANSEKHSDSENPPIRNTSDSVSANGRSIVNGAGENGQAHEDIGDSDSDSGSGSIEPGGHDDEDLDEENHDGGCDSEDEDDDDGGGPASDDDDEVRVRQKVAEVDPLEEASFEQELRAVLQESMEQRRLELRGRPALNMMIPMNVFEGSTKDHHGRGVGGESGDEALDEEAGGSKEVQVKVLVKRGNKQQTKQMYIPRDCSLVQSTKQKEAADFEEKQDIKRLVLEYNDREEEELNGLGSQTMNWSQGPHRGSTRGSTWEGTGGRGSGSRHRHQNYSSGGLYYGRKR